MIMIMAMIKRLDMKTTAVYVLFNNIFKWWYMKFLSLTE